jgi:hypothetical protein
LADIAQPHIHTIFRHPVNIADILGSIRWSQLLLTASVMVLVALVHRIVLAPTLRRLMTDRDRSTKQVRLVTINDLAERLTTDMLLAVAGNGSSPKQLQEQIDVLQVACLSIAEHVLYSQAIRRIVEHSESLLTGLGSQAGESAMIVGIGDLQRSHAILSREFHSALNSI